MEKELQEKDQAPDFNLPASNGEQLSLNSLRGKWVVLYFYPRDNTLGCSREACAFRDLKPKLAKKKTVVVGVSRDGLASHDKFIKKFGLNFLLVADEAGALCQAYGVQKRKSMFGVKFLGIERSTFLIDPEGKIAKIWRKVKVDGHAEEVLNFLP